MTPSFQSEKPRFKIHVPFLGTWLLLSVHHLFFCRIIIIKKTESRFQDGNILHESLTSWKTKTCVVLSLFCLLWLFVCKLDLKGAFVFFSVLLVLRPSPQRPKIGLAALRHMAATQWHKKLSRVKGRQGDIHEVHNLYFIFVMWVKGCPKHLSLREIRLKSWDI